MLASRNRSTWLCCLAAASLVSASCASDVTSESAASEVEPLAMMAECVPELARLLERAKGKPVQREASGTGFRVRPIDGAARFDGAWYPALADGPIRIGTTGAAPMTLHRLHANPAPAVLRDGTLVYEGAAPSADVVALGTQHGVEDLLVAHAADAELGYRLDLPPSWRLHAPAEVAGLVEVRDGGGAARLRMWAREAWDAEGRRVPVTLHVEQDTIRLSIGEAQAWPVVVDPEWLGTDTMAARRLLPCTTTLPDGRVLISGGDESAVGLCELYDPSLGTFTHAGTMKRPRSGHTTTLLPTGEVLLAGGGRMATGQYFFEFEVYDPTSATFVFRGEVDVRRFLHTATLLPSGKVLLAGGRSPDGATASAEVYDPSTGSSVAVGPMTTPRSEHIAVLLPSGLVLLAGGFDGTAALASSEIFNPDSGKFAPGPPMTHGRISPSGTVLPSGSVLVAGGCPTVDGNTVFAQCGAPTDSVEVFDPDEGAFAAAGVLATPRYFHGASILPSGNVLFVGGISTGNVGVAAAEVFHPDTATAEPLANMGQARSGSGIALLHTGKVLVVGGGDADFVPLDSAELVAADGGPRIPFTLRSSRRSHTATLLASGEVLIVGGADDAGVTAACDLFDPVTHLFNYTDSLSSPRQGHTASVLPSGEVLIAGGTPGNDTYLRSTELYDPSTHTFRVGPETLEGRAFHVATVLDGGKVLFAGGQNATSNLVTTEVFDPVSKSFSPAGEMNVARSAVRGTRLSDGRVLFNGGLANGNWVTKSEIYDPLSPLSSAFTVGDTMYPLGYFTATLLDTGDVLCVGQSWSYTALLFDHASETFEHIAGATVRRDLQTAAVLQDGGKVLLAGGRDMADVIVRDAELYDPATGKFESTGSMFAARVDHTATTLQNGDVLVVGGKNYVGASPPVEKVLHASAELYDSASGSFAGTPVVETALSGAFTATRTRSGEVLWVGAAEASLYDPDSTQRRSPTGVDARAGHTATTLRSGAVLLAGGRDAAGLLRSAVVYDIETDSAQTSEMVHPREDHSATMLRDGRVLLVGGRDDGGPIAEAEWYDPQANAFTPAASLQTPRARHGAALLSSGRVLIAGGADADGVWLYGAEVFDPATSAFEPVGDVGGFGPVEALSLPGGDVLLAGNGWTCRWVESSQLCIPVTASVLTPFALLPSLSGASMLCGAELCRLLADGSNEEWSTLGLRHSGWDDVQERNGAATTTADGNYLLTTPSDGVVRIPIVSDGVVPPAIAEADSDTQLVGGLEARIRGQRFQTRPVLAGESAVPSPDVVPLVAFMPANDGRVAYGRVVRWTDTELDWIPPVESHTGPGWVHVVVNAVPSRAMFAVLEAPPDGTSCASDAHCASGICVDQVCCNSRCTGACESCLASVQGDGGQDGVCRAVAQGLDPKEACKQDEPATCGQSGVCDGSGVCERYAEDFDCGRGVCRSGVCRWCDGDILASSEGYADCAPFACMDARCLEHCASALDCAAAHVCSSDGVCRSAPAFEEPTDPGMCAYRAQRGAARWPWLVVLCVALAVMRRRGCRKLGNRAAR